MTVRPYRDADRAAVYDVCVRTGEAGGDARGRYASDDLLPDVYAGPYLHLEPGLASVLDEGGRAVGYVLGTADTPAFVRRWRAEWLPLAAPRHPVPVERPGTPDEALVAALHRPEGMLRPGLEGYPAHLHVDVLPGHQGAGHGRALVERFLAAVAAAGAPAVHLGVDVSNTRALAFYDRLGFHEVPVDGTPGTAWLGRATG